MLEYLLSVLLVLCAVFLWTRKKSGYPPGPRGFPVVGYLPFLGKNVHLKLGELGEKYGDVFSVQLGSVRVVVLHSAASAREGLHHPDVQGRPEIGSFSILGFKSPFFTNDMSVWLEQRKFIVHALKDLGFGKSKLEDQIREEIGHFLSLLSSWQSQPKPIESALLSTVSNNICSLIVGKRYGYDEPERQKLDRNIQRVIAMIGQTAGHIFLPWMKHLPFAVKWMGYEEGIRASKETLDIFRKKLDEHKATLDRSNVRDFMDSYLIEMEQRKQRDDGTYFSEQTLLANASDLLGAGSESVSTSLNWLVYIAAAYPDIQNRIRTEIIDVLGPDRMPEYSDLKRMPLTHSVILETLRWKTIVPINALRSTTSDVTVCGVRIPSGTTITANFWAIHHDPALWEDPDNFVPDRFLEEGTIQKPAHFMPFALGKRVCPGEGMANVEIFLYFVSILQKFEVRFPEGYQPTFEADVTITYKPKPYVVSFVPVER